jgi:hypothetical protein
MPMTEQHLDAELLADLIDSWAETAMKKQLSGAGYAREIAKKTLEWAAPVLRQQSADLELEEIIHWLLTGPYGASIVDLVADLRAARRPKPPSLQTQALNDLEEIAVTLMKNNLPCNTGSIRRALEAMPND